MACQEGVCRLRTHSPSHVLWLFLSRILYDNGVTVKLFPECAVSCSSQSSNWRWAGGEPSNL